MNINKGLDYLIKVDKRFSLIIDQFGRPKFLFIENFFESLVRSIIYQQLSGKAALTIHDRFQKLFNLSKYPDPKNILNMSLNDLQSVGLSKQKTAYIKDLSEKILSKEVDFSNYKNYSDEEISSELIKVKGIGQWTIDMFLMFTLARPDIFPVKDLGIQKGFIKLNQITHKPSHKEMISESLHWSPYRSIATWYLWKIADESKK